MKTIPASARIIIPFGQSLPARFKLAHPDLQELALPAGLASNGPVLLCGENILLPSAGHPRFRYGCCAYVVAEGGRKALPVIGCRAWFQAPLPAKPHTHPVWTDLGGGLMEAVLRLSEAAFDLHGAVAAARSWMNRRHADVATFQGCAVLTGRDAHVLCAALPEGRPTQGALATVAQLGTFPVRSETGLRMAA